ncbi:hypothetical protein J5N97_021007 [Dioscorea zingiberensis]|uniref:ClpA/ClpB AAA lid domain-containing protein n=1 Tax=Dioscorea zingiberensis TaxID=325984 RepID=A0A9D5CGV8_9LILI|nr:hypothetical protein J5N97_021007 [Dioscorea zingiberensis]
MLRLVVLVSSQWFCGLYHQLIWRVDDTKGTLQIERNRDIGWHGFLVPFYQADRQCEKNFYPLCGIIEDLKAFINDLTQATNKDVAGFVPLQLPEAMYHHHIKFSDEALISAAKLSDQYIRDCFLPDKAIDLVDEAGSLVNLRHVQVRRECATDAEWC